MNLPSDTIAAIATPPGFAGISIVRISGPEAHRIADSIFTASRTPVARQAPGTFTHGHVHMPGMAQRDAVLDEAILLKFCSPHSYTGDDVVELQGHGGPVCSRRVLHAALAAGARLAEPGEFTRRAFLNGRIDLVQAEAVADLIRAQTDRSASAAMEQLDGRLSGEFNALLDGIRAVAADVEATLDFSEHELPEHVTTGIRERLGALVERVSNLLETWHEGRVLREGTLVVIAGGPNAGKSTLLNRLVGSERAIVTDVPGTTRDSIEEMIVVDGYPVRLVDTAGLRPTDCRVEQLGVQRAEEYLARADVILYVVDGSDRPTPYDTERLAGLAGRTHALVLNKTDLGQSAEWDRLHQHEVIRCSALMGTGIDYLLKTLARLAGLASGATTHAVISQRHLTIVQNVRNELSTAVTLCSANGSRDVSVMIAEHLRSSVDSLGEVTGATYSDAILDSIFSKFCVGK